LVLLNLALRLKNKLIKLIKYLRAIAR
ncbi:MAG: hypothetical protein RLZZ171_2160, partial [Cyanobacteriota bacterium]